MRDLSLNDRRNLVTQLTSGIIQFKFCNKLYSLCQPCYEILNNANCLYNNIITDNKFGIWLSDEDVEDILIKQGLWDKCNEIRITKLSEMLDNHKVDLYKSYCTNLDGVRRCKRLISQTRATINTAFRYKYSFHLWTLHGYADNVRKRYLTMRTMYYDNKTVYKDSDMFENTSFHLLDTAISAKEQSSLNDTTIRQLVRKDPWKTLWSIGKPNPFNFHFLELTEEQKLTLVFSKMYENISNSPDCPPDDVIKDDDALDGWLIQQNREQEQQKTNQKVQSILTAKQQHGTEIFLPAKNIEDAQKIEQLNTNDVKMLKKQRQALIQQKGTVKEKEFFDIQLNTQTMSNQQFKDHIQNK